MSAALLQGKLVVITGAASGIGRATAVLLARHGALLSLADIDAEKLAALKLELRKPDDELLASVVDVRSSRACNQWIADTVAHFGGRPIWAAANVAGVFGTSGSTEKGLLRNLSDDEFETIMDTNVRGVFNCLRAELPHMKVGRDGRDGGSIVNTSSIAGIKGLQLNSVYSATKHAVIGLTRSVALEEGKRAIRVNAIAPGAIATPMLDKCARDMGVPIEALFGETEPGPLARRGGPEEVAEMISFLLSPASSFVNGSVLGVDGGWAA